MSSGYLTANGADEATPQANVSKHDISQTFEKLTLPDCFGQHFELKELNSAPLVVVAFVGTECPLAKLYGPRLQELSIRYADHGVRFVGICSNVQDSLTEIVAYRNKAGITFPMLIDSQQELADLLQAQRTPAIVVLNKDRAVQYRGRID
ncbi:MAG: redoxin domain-containing protein, partial [Planctomycetota bacterium]